MVVPPLSSILIALGLLCVSILIFNRVRKPPLVGKWTARALLGCTIPLLAAGFALHFSGPAPSDRSAALRSASSPAARAAKRAEAGWSFSFEPKSARWGQEVTIRVTPPKDDVTVYYNGRPLPARPKGNGILVVTVPAISKDGRFSLESGGTRVEAEDRLVIKVD